MGWHSVFHARLLEALVCQRVHALLLLETLFGKHARHSIQARLPAPPSRAFMNSGRAKNALTAASHARLDQASAQSVWLAMSRSTGEGHEAGFPPAAC